MSNKSKSAIKRYFTIPVALGVVLLASVFTTTAYASDKGPDLPQRSQAELNQFWNSHLKKILADQLVVGKYPIAAVNTLYAQRANAITQRYGKPYRVTLSTDYARGDKYAGAGCMIQGDTPILVVYVPNLMLIYNELLARDASPEKDFESTLLVLFCHELDHIALGFIGESNPTKIQHIENEKGAWAATTEGIITTLMNAGAPIDASDLFYYRSWIACGRQNNACWGFVISKIYNNATRGYQ